MLIQRGNASRPRVKSAHRHLPSQSDLSNTRGKFYLNLNSNFYLDTSAKQHRPGTAGYKSLLNSRAASLFTASEAQPGIYGYYCQKIGLQHRNPDYSFLKDKSSSFIAVVQKKARKTPDCRKYSRPLSWCTNNGKWYAKPERKTWADEVVEHSKKIPAPSKYDNQTVYKIPLGVISKEKTPNLMSELEYLAQQRQGPTSYEPKVSCIYKFCNLNCLADSNWETVLQHEDHFASQGFGDRLPSLKNKQAGLWVLRTINCNWQVKKAQSEVLFRAPKWNWKTKT